MSRFDDVAFRPAMSPEEEIAKANEFREEREEFTPNWRIDEERSDCDGFAVVSTLDDSLFECFDTRDAAVEQLAELLVIDEESEAEVTAAALGADDLPIAQEDTPWDPAAAHERLVEFATVDGVLDPETMRLYHLYLPDDADPLDPNAYQLHFADLTEGAEVPHVVPAALDWVVDELSTRTDLPEADLTAIRDRLAVYLDRVVSDESLAEPVPEDAVIIEAELEATAYSAFRSLPPLPADAFRDPSDRLLDEGQHIGYDDGRIWGWVAQNGVCHDAFSGQCVVPPKKGTDLDTFNRQPITLDDGSTVKVGVITMDAGHDNDGADVQHFRAQFDDTRTVAGLVRVGINDRGTWFSGIAAPWLSEWDVRVLTTCRPSGHWKRLRGGRWSLRAVLSVPVPGFPARVAASAAVTRSNLALAASAVPVLELELEEEEQTLEELDTDERGMDYDRMITDIANAVVDEMESRRAISTELEVLSEAIGESRAALALKMREELGLDAEVFHTPGGIDHDQMTHGNRRSRAESLRKVDASGRIKVGDMSIPVTDPAAKVVNALDELTRQLERISRAKDAAMPNGVHDPEIMSSEEMYALDIDEATIETQHDSIMDDLKEINPDVHEQWVDDQLEFTDEQLAAGVDVDADDAAAGAEEAEVSVDAVPSQQDYVNVADELNATPSDDPNAPPPLTVDDLKPEVVANAKAYAEENGLPWPPGVGGEAGE